MVNLRKILFYLNDTIKGAKLKKHLEDINSVLFKLSYEDRKKELNTRLEKITNHACQQVPFYSNQQLYSLESFPVVNKSIIKDNLNSFVTKGVDTSTLFRVVTSGSTGTPFGVYHDKSKKLRNTADTIFFGNLAGFEIGIKLNYLKIWTVVNRKSGFKSFLENINPIDVTQLGDENLKLLVETLVSTNMKQSFLGYATALETLCNYLEKNSPSTRIPHVTSVIAMSEGLNPIAKKKIHTYFGVYGVSRYSNVENGIIAQQPADGSNSFRVNWASYYVEILDMETDKPIEIGQIGRIVVTDLFNFAMPMIRYDTGDIGKLDWDSSCKDLCLVQVEGRKMDLVYDVDGNMVSSFTITNNMWLYPEITQYQFIQETKDSYLFKLNLKGTFDKESQLIEEFKKFFGSTASIRVEYVNEIPLLNSGKRKKVLNLVIN
jgi:phenylacetate-CoA ligase